MPRFEPFRGLRYDLDRLTHRDQSLDAVIAPPYDVIDPEERAVLAARSRWNAVHLELPEPDPDAGLDRYAAAADLLRRWREDRVLVLDARPVLSVYRMRFRDQAGRPRETTGVLGALEVSPPGQGDVLPHERTMAKPKSDRLDLLRACRTNLSPIWGLSLAAGLSDLLQISGPPDAGARDDDGVTHELWVITEPGPVAAISGTVASAPVLLADGHHRYETAVTYARERRSAEQGRGGPYDLILAYVVELSEEQLAIGPIHRMIAGLPPGFDVTGALERHFELRSAGRPPRPDGHLSGLLADGGGPLVVTREGAWFLAARPETVAKADDDLDSSHLDLALGDLPGPDVSYHHDPAEVVDAVGAGRAAAGVLVRAAPVAVIARAARERRLLPAKTTFFTPKPRTGMVFRPLEE